MPETSARDPVVAGVFRRPLAEQVAFFRAKVANLVPTARWTDMRHAAHDRGFMTAGAQSADLLAGLAAAVGRAEAEGISIDAFRKDFAALVERHGWGFRGETNWRTRTIYRTNLSTSYAAGRLAQLRDAGFPYWMYKHGGSAEPRAHHLAWNGLVLPADHAFWKTHYPPNAWGCSCRVIGLRSRDDARHYGGDPRKMLPENWDERDAATGEPVGIGDGWGYQPGDSVSGIVSTIAAKTAQWDSALAKAYMQLVPERTRDALAVAYRGLPSVANDARLFAQRVAERKDVPPYRTLGLVTSNDAERVGRAVAGYDYAIDAHAVARSIGGAVDAGHRAVDAADFARLPALLNLPDSVEAVDGANGAALVRITRRFGRATYIAQFRVDARADTLVLDRLRVQQ